MPFLRSLFFVLVVLCLAPTAASALDFPALTGRVVDQAGIVDAGTSSDISAKSKDLEAKSGIQLVIATIPSLQGSDIETYANELFRFWKLGQAQKNNGVLLLVAPKERKVRIEVGYGLEGTLTDALSSTIIAKAIVPHFRNGDFSGGIEGGVGGIIDVLSGDSANWQPEPEQTSGTQPGLGTLIVIAFFVIFILAVVIFAIKNALFPAGHYVKRGGRMVFVRARSSSSSSSAWGSGSSSGGSSSDFSGGGGSSGGGGASGSW